MKTIIGLGLSLMITAGLMGCTSTSNNANLRNANVNTGYMVNNSNMTSPMPMTTSSPMATSNMSNNMTNRGSRADSDIRSNANSGMKSKPLPNTNMKANGNRN